MQPQVGKGWEGSVKIISTTKKFWSIVENSELLETKLYENFKCDNKNRPISEDKVLFFIKQFKEGKFFMKEFPVIVDKNATILDGQHRYEAVKRMGLPLYFRFAFSLCIDNIIDVQVNAGWKTEDYIHAFIKQKNQNYIILSRFIAKYKITASVGVLLLAGTHSLKSAGFYEGEFIVKNEERAHILADAINEIGGLAFGLNRDKSFCVAVIKVIEHPEYDHKRMIEQLTKYSSIMKRQMTTDAYIRNMEEVYNYKLYTKNKARFI